MGKGKLQRFVEIDRFDNVLELTDFRETNNPKPKDRWHRDIFQNKNPIVLELACGKGAYTLELARRNPEINYVGVDIKGARIWKGAKIAQEEQLENVRFLRIYIDHLQEYFAENEVQEIWITFPDPYPKGSDRSKRLSSEKFLKQYQKVLRKNGIVHLKTDSLLLFDFSKRSVQDFEGTIIKENDNVHAGVEKEPPLDIRTDFEQKHLQRGRSIKYLKFRLPSS